MARIGVVLDRSNPCRYSRGAEGMGLTNIMKRYWYSELGSGKLAYYSSYEFKKTTITVYGSPYPEEAVEDVLDMSFVPIKYDEYSRFPVRDYDVGSGVVPEEDTQFTYVFYIKLKRTERFWGDIFQHGTSYRSPAMWVRYDIYYNYPYNLWYTGRSLHIRMATDYSTNEGIDAYASLQLGRWYQVAIMVDRKQWAVAYDGKVFR